MVVKYDVVCFDRELIIICPEKDAHVKSYIEHILDLAYTKWNNVEDISDKEEQVYVESAPCEEYMMKCLNLLYPNWICWTSRYYGDDPNEIDSNGRWIKNKGR